MSKSEKKNIEIIEDLFGSNVYFPLFSILTLIALVSSLQSYYMFFRGSHSFFNYILLLTSKLIYCWGFILIAVVVRVLSKNIILARKNLIKWISIHITGLIVLSGFHQALSFSADTFLLGENYRESFWRYTFYNPSLYADFLFYVLLLLGFYLNEYKKLSRENEVKCSQLENQLIQSKLHELRSKIHPQFLFNTLNTISGLIGKEQNKDANKILTSLSDFLRTTVYDSDNDEVTLDEEIEFLLKYLEIEKESFENRFVYNENIDQETLGAVVPSFILQPIVEEIMYKFFVPGEKKFSIEIVSKKHDDELEIIIGFIQTENSKLEIHFDEDSVLAITRRRLEKLFGTGHMLSIENDSILGINVRMQIPYSLKLISDELVFASEND